MDASIEVAARKGQAAEFSCENCDAKLTFKPGTTNLACEYCGHNHQIRPEAPQPIREYDLMNALAQAKLAPASAVAEGGREIKCETCAAVTVMTKAADHCPFCGSPRVAEQQGGGNLIVPESLLEFGVDRNRANELFKKWLASRWFAPSDLNDRAQKQGMDGVYLPYWLFDARTETPYYGSRGDHYYVEERSTNAQGQTITRRVRKTRWTSRRGHVQVAFDDLAVCATKSVPRLLVEALEPWDTKALRPYQPQYLSGFSAEKYSIELPGAYDTAKERMDKRILDAIEADIGGDEQRVTWKQTAYEDVRYKHTLFPLWIAAFRYHDKVYRVLVNARSGEISGERPYSTLKIVLFVAAIIGVLVLLFTLLRR